MCCPNHVDERGVRTKPASTISSKAFLVSQSHSGCVGEDIEYAYVVEGQWLECNKKKTTVGHNSVGGLRKNRIIR